MADYYELPPGGRARDYERKALRIRKFAGVRGGVAVDPYALAASLGLKLVEPQAIEALPAEFRNQLLHIDARGWSGSVTPVLPDGSRIVVLNPLQSDSRRASTLMEEICHVLLGHEADRLDFGETRGSRVYDEEKESEAYGVGAAVLLPFHVLREWLSEFRASGRDLESLNKDGDIAALGRRYGVSRALVVYRMRIVGIWSELRSFGSHSY